MKNDYSIRLKKISILFLLICNSHLPIEVFCQNNIQNTIKTIENSGGKKRREIFLDSNMNVVKEVYFDYQYSNKTAEILYEKNKIKIKGFDKIGNVIFDYMTSEDSGFYNDTESGVFLKFDKSGFNGIQKSNNLIVNFSNNRKNGRLIQIDNAIVGQKYVSVGRVDWRYLRFDIDKYYYSTEKENVYKDYKGLILNFVDGKLDGLQKSLFVDNKIKFISNFKNGKLINYNSFDTSKNIISRIETNDGISLKNQILNGSIIDNKKNYVFINKELESAGDIYIEAVSKKINISLTNGIDYGNINDFLEISDSESAKKIFDDNKYFLPNVEALKILFKIPNFKIKKFIYDNEEDLNILPVEVKILNRSQEPIKFKIDTLEFSNQYYTLYHNYLFDKDSRFFTFSNKFYSNPDDVNNYFNYLFKFNNDIMYSLNQYYGLPNTFFGVNKEEGDTEESWFYDSTQYTFDFLLNKFVDGMLQNLEKLKRLKRADIYDEYDKKYVTQDYISPFGDYVGVLLFGSPIVIANRNNRKYMKINTPYDFEISDETGVYEFKFDNRFKSVKFLQKVTIKQQ